MPEKSDFWKFLVETAQAAMPWLSTLMISAFATAAQYAQKVRAGERFSWRAIFLDATICIFVGVLTHMICTWQGLEGVGRSVLVAISAHMGTRAMLLYENWRDRVLGLRISEEQRP